MNHIKILTVIIFITISFNPLLKAQSLYMPVSIAKAYDNKTRSLDGKPGEKYWMNKAEYIIDVDVNPLDNKLIGREKIIYYNNSPDDLYRITLRIYMDLFKKGNRRNMQLSPEAVTDGVDIQKIIVSGTELNLNSDKVERDGTNLIVYLSEPLKTKGKIKLQFVWSYKIPDINKIRTGVYYSSSFLISLWYPQISVYDDIDGWDIFQYTGLQEFYNDYSDFEVNITVPKEFVVWATGNQTNMRETFSEKYIERIKTATKTEKATNIITEEDRVNNSITKKEYNIWRYKAEHVPDFAFAISNKYLWDMKKVVINRNSNNSVLVSAVYNRDSKDFYEVADIAGQSIQLMGSHLPGVPFPYEKVIIFNSDGTSGMEFPMLINDGSFKNRWRTAGITSHELLHQYFPFYVGTNERKYAWMDEGWARMMQFDIQKTIEPSLNKKATVVEKYSKYGGQDFDVPLIVPSTLFDSYLPYKTHAYTRPAMAIIALEKYRGIDILRKALGEYISRWEGKHPIPYDFFYTFNEVYEEDLSWFWMPWFFEFGYPDLGIKNVEERSGQIIAEIQKVGEFPIPIELKVTYKNGTEIIYSKNTGVWKNGKTIFEINISSKSKIEKIELGSIEIPDVNNKNNSYQFGE